LSGLLLDTHALLWWRGEHRRIGASAHDAIEDPDVPVFFSAASVWEIAIKHAVGKLNMPESLVGTMQDRGFTELAVNVSHALRAAALPAHHRDPFDRMLVAQACEENLTLVTNDARIAAYDVPILW
jgi:PIN domain nuclease of toxin-antitoxin system